MYKIYKQMWAFYTQQSATDFTVPLKHLWKTSQPQKVADQSAVSVTLSLTQTFYLPYRTQPFNWISCTTTD